MEPKQSLESEWEERVARKRGVFAADWKLGLGILIVIFITFALASCNCKAGGDFFSTAACSSDRNDQD